MYECPTGCEERAPCSSWRGGSPPRTADLLFEREGRTCESTRKAAVYTHSSLASVPASSGSVHTQHSGVSSSASNTRRLTCSSACSSACACALCCEGSRCSVACTGPPALEEGFFPPSSACAPVASSSRGSGSVCASGVSSAASSSSSASNPPGAFKLRTSERKSCAMGVRVGPSGSVSLLGMCTTGVSMGSEPLRFCRLTTSGAPRLACQTPRPILTGARCSRSTDEGG